jgi:hypothetical protein
MRPARGVPLRLWGRCPACDRRSGLPFKIRHAFLDSFLLRILVCVLSFKPFT